MRRIRHGVLAALAVLSSGCQSVLFNALKVPALSQDYTLETITLQQSPLLQADVYRPLDATGPHPTVVFFYGGSWRNGERNWYRFAGASLAEAGYTVIIPDYRKAPEVVFPAFVEDAAVAVAQVRAHIDHYGGDPRQLFLMGHSAGAHIAGLLVTDARYLAAHQMRPRDLAGFIGVAGPYDFLPMTSRRIIEVYGGNAEHPESQPVTFVNGDEPPALLLHGAQDRLVWARNSESLHRRLLDAGVPSTLHIYPDTGHIGILLAMGRGLRGRAPTLKDAVQFIRDPAAFSTAAQP